MTKKQRHFKSDLQSGMNVLTSRQHEDPTILAFGKHRGKNLWKVALNDPDWIMWAAEKIHWFKKHLNEVAPELLVVLRMAKLEADLSEEDWVLNPVGEMPKYFHIYVAKHLATFRRKTRKL